MLLIAVVEAPAVRRKSFVAALETVEAAGLSRKALLDKSMVGRKRMDTVCFIVGGVPFDAVALACEQNSPVLKDLLDNVENIYQEVIPVPVCGNLNDAAMYEVRSSSCANLDAYARWQFSFMCAPV